MWLASLRTTKRVERLSARYLSRGFSKRGDLQRVLVFHDANRISYAQLYPFFHYANELRQHYRVEIRAHSFQSLINAKNSIAADIDVVLLQPWYDRSSEDLQQAYANLSRFYPKAAISFIDSFAHNDLRLAGGLPDQLQFYFKKSLFRDPQNYLRSYRGDTNLSQYYGDLYGLDLQTADFGAPERVLDKLRLSPGFFTAPHFIRAFDAPTPPSQVGRSIDMQMRLGYKGLDWYQGMREASIEAASAIGGISFSATGVISKARYMDEMRQCRLCFSPFGYGELCWRDIEAFATGSVLIKPDMAHLRTQPELFEPGVTYLPVKWDFSDLEEVVTRAVRNDDQLTQIARQAYSRVQNYLRQDQFVSDMSIMFER